MAAYTVIRRTREQRIARFLYYCKMTNGVTIEADDFKTVFNAARREIRNTYGHGLYYDCGIGIIYYGLVVDTGLRCQYVPERECARIWCSSINHVTTYNVQKGYGVI